MTNWRRAITILCTAAFMLLTVPAPASAYIHEGVGPLRRASGSYTWFIEVCAHSNTGSSTWNTTGIPFHGRVKGAVDSWNALGTEVRYSLSNSCAASETSVLVQNGNLPTGVYAQFQSTQSVACLEGWGVTCWKKATITINNADYTGYDGIGTPPAGTYDLWSLLAHEFGHGLVLDDDNTGPSDQTMNDAASPSSTFRRSLTMGLNNGSDEDGRCDAFNDC